MKLNQECVRDILLYFEENLSYSNSISTSNLSLKDYTCDEITYTIDKLHQYGYIDAHPIIADGMMPIFKVYSLTYEGHQFLDNIRDNKVWLKTKSTVSKFASVSISVLADVASSIIKSSIGTS